MKKTDEQLKADIEEELRWDRKVNAARIGVTVEQGVVSLFGEVDSYADKWAAEAAVKRVRGVRTVAQDLMVKVLAEHVHTDTELAVATQNALEWNFYVPKTVRATVTHGTVTLQGTVSWNHERHAAEWAVRHLTGVVAVYDDIVVEGRAVVEHVKEKVEAALLRQAGADGQSIVVAADGGKVTLSGHAPSWQMIEDAENAAWGAPGVTEVIDQVTLSPRAW